MTFGDKENFSSFGPSLWLEKEQESELLSTLDSTIVSNTPFAWEIRFNSNDWLNNTSVDFQKLYDAIDVENFGSKGAKNLIMLDNKFYTIPRWGILAKFIQHKILCESNAITHMSDDEIKVFCDGKIGKLSLLEKQKSIDVNQMKNTIKWDLTTMGVVKNPNHSEFSYELWESSWNVEEAKKFAQAILHWDTSWVLEKDILWEKWDQIFNIMFSVDMKPVVKASTKKTIEKEFLIYKQLAKIILPNSNASHLDALTTEWKWWYDSIYNAKLWYNRAMNAIVSTYLIWSNRNTGIATELEHAKSLESLVAIFQKSKKNNTLPKYSFTFRGDWFGQYKWINSRLASSQHRWQYLGESSNKTWWKVYKYNEVDRSNRTKNEMWELTFDPRTNTWGTWVKKDKNWKITGGWQFSYPDESKYRDWTFRKFDENWNYISKF